MHCIYRQNTFNIKHYRIKQCEENPCHNNGVCNNTNEGKGYTCNCTGYYGERQCDTGNPIKKELFAWYMYDKPLVFTND